MYRMNFKIKNETNFYSHDIKLNLIKNIFNFFYHKIPLT
jgi:hypothetical protein